MEVHKWSQIDGYRKNTIESENNVIELKNTERSPCYSQNIKKAH